jgi:3',5'-cyclic AMP phosphodiesterase CpdA
VVQIVDYSATSQDMFWNATIPYSGTAFYSTCTQLEFQPSPAYPIQDYYFNGTLYNIAYVDSYSTMQTLNGSYMLPFILNALPTWSFAYYDSSLSGYQQIE